jgi:hypothetical protein
VILLLQAAGVVAGLLFALVGAVSPERVRRWMSALSEPYLQ